MDPGSPETWPEKSKYHSHFHWKTITIHFKLIWLLLQYRVSTNLRKSMRLEHEKNYHHGRKVFHKKISIQCIVSIFSTILFGFHIFTINLDFHIIFDFFLIVSLNFRVGSFITGGFDFWNKKTLRSSISIGCWRSARNDQRQIFEHILTKQSKKIKWTTLGQIAELVTNNIPLP